MKPDICRKALDRVIPALQLAEILVKAQEMVFEEARTKLHRRRARMNELRAERTRLEEQLNGHAEAAE